MAKWKGIVSRYNPRNTEEGKRADGMYSSRSGQYVAFRSYKKLYETALELMGRVQELEQIIETRELIERAYAAGEPEQQAMPVMQEEAGSREAQQSLALSVLLGQGDSERLRGEEDEE